MRRRTSALPRDSIHLARTEQLAKKMDVYDRPQVLRALHGVSPPYKH